MVWSIRYLPDPLNENLADNNGKKGASSTPVYCSLAHASVSLEEVIDPIDRAAFNEDKNTARIALADHVARHINSIQGAASVAHQEQERFTAVVQLLDRTTTLLRRGRKTNSSAPSYPPYILQRTDIWCNETELNVIVRVLVFENTSNGHDNGHEQDALTDDLVKSRTNGFFANELCFNKKDLMNHVACAVLQQRVRSQLKSLSAVAFVANGAILPRKSGASSMPMASPPAVPFAAPQDSPMSRDINVDMGKLRPYTIVPNSNSDEEGVSSVTLSGLCIPTGITLICGGGYHGKV